MSFSPPLESLRIKNVLSFGAEPATIELGPLNVLIGPNGSGKSNLIQVIGLLKSAPRDLAAAIRVEDGISEWLWKGQSNPTATVEAIVRYQHKPLRYSLEFMRSGHRLEITDERLENKDPYPGHDEPYFYFAYEDGTPFINVGGSKRFLKRDSLNPQLSVLSQRKDPEQYPELTHVGALFERFQLYRDWEFGNIAGVREVSRVDVPDEWLEEDFGNLGIIINKLKSDPTVNSKLKEYLSRFAPDVVDVHTRVRQGRVELSLEERHLQSPVPATRWSDGMIRWVALLAILLNPEAPPVVCIEEPELGMHPDMIPEVATLLIDASSRMQLIGTTHSAQLVDALSDQPESVIVCEKSNGSTNVRRLSKRELPNWLEDYTLGRLWREGHLGGNRW
jgi:predicted ATPase